jgi:hypothetical protein
LTLDLRDGVGALTVHKNDARLGVLARGMILQEREGGRARADGETTIAAGLCWMVQLASAGQAVRIQLPTRLGGGGAGGGGSQRPLRQLASQ